MFSRGAVQLKWFSVWFYVLHTEPHGFLSSVVSGPDGVSELYFLLRKYHQWDLIRARKLNLRKTHRDTDTHSDTQGHTHTETRIIHTHTR